MLRCELFALFGATPIASARDEGNVSPPGFESEAWQAAALGADEHQCAPMFRERLRELGLLDFLPDPVLDQLARAARVTAARNLRGAYQLQELTTRLDGRAPVIALKGASLVRTCYRDISLRPMLDLDVLARESDLPIVREALKQLGYGQSLRTDPQLSSLHGHHDPPYTRDGMHSVELHRSLLEARDPFRIDPEGLWARAVPTQDTSGLFYLSQEDQLLHVCLHAGYHHQLDIGLYAFIDIAVIASNPQLSWQRTIERAREWQAERCVFLILEMARILVRAEIPDAVLRALRPRDFEDDIVRRALSIIYNRKPRGYEPTAFLARILTELIMQGGWRHIPGQVRRRLLRKSEMRLRWPNSPHAPTLYGQFAPLLTGMVRLASRRRDREHLRSRLDAVRVQRWMAPTP